MTQYPDIEIYIMRADAESVQAWLNTVFDKVTPANSEGKWRCEYQGQSIEVQLTPQAEKNFASLWFKQNHTPWKTDLDCARAAHAALDTEVRCQASDWKESEGVSDAGWIKLLRGEEKPFEWI